MSVARFKNRCFLSLAHFMLKFQPGVSHMLFSGAGSSEQLVRHMSRAGSRKILVITDKMLVDAGVVKQALSGLNTQEMDVRIFDGVLPDPSYAVVDRGLEMYRNESCDTILAIGGGSSIDAAKIIALRVNNHGDPRDYVGMNKFKQPLPPFYAIPTTAGTGSEATVGAVITDEKTHEKTIIVGQALLPLAACLDVDLMLGLPASVTAATGMDALTHAVEAYISLWDRDGSDGKARIAVKLIFEHLRTAVEDGGNAEAREAMAYAAYSAGQAINAVNVGNVHALAHQLGAHYGLPHGLANALVLPEVLNMSLDAAREPLGQLAQLIGLSTAEEFIDAVVALNHDIGIPKYCAALQRGDVPELAQRAFDEGGEYACRRFMELKDAQKILNALLTPS